MTSPRDIPYGEERIIVHWNKTRWRCREDYCMRSSFTETIAQIPARARNTGRLRTPIGAAIGEAARSVAEVAASRSVSWPTAHRAFVAHADVVLGEPEPARVLGIDETRGGKPRWEYCAQTQRWRAGDQGLLGQRAGRTSVAVIDWLSERSVQFRERIEFVAIDTAASYAAAIRTEGLLPNATLVVDHFHLVKLANDALTKVRRRITWELRDRRGRKIDPEWANRRRLLTARVGVDPHLPRHRLHRFLCWCIDSQIPELLTLATTIDTWWPEINTVIATGITNARTEGYNRLVKQVKRVGCGFRNRENSARRIRFHCTRNQRAATQTSC